MFRHISRTVIECAALLLACCAMTGSLFANSISAVSVEPTIECAGVIATLAGTDAPGHVSLEVKESGEMEFRQAHPLTRYDNYHMAGSLFDLKPGTSYDIRVTLGGQAVTSSFKTRPDFATPAPLRTVAVRNSSELVAAINDARPGDEILLSPGTYGGGLTISASGTAEHPIVIRGNVPSGEKTRPVDQRTGLPVINGSGKSPVITVTGAHVVLDGIRLENTSLIGISLSSTRYCVVQGCQVTGSSSGWNHFIYVNGGRSAGGRHLIQDNFLLDRGSGFGYGILQDRYPGPGTIIRRNILSGFYDSINPSGNEGDLNDANLPETHSDVLGAWPNHSTDVYENTVRVSRDDDIEVDGIAVNMRIFRNMLSTGAGNHCVNGISIAPVAPGPFFFVGNVIANFSEGAIKYNTASYRGTIRNCFFYHNTIKNDEGVARRGTLLTLWEGTGYPGTPSKNTVYKNNIFAGDKMLIQRLITVHTPQYDPNCWYSRQTSGTLYQWDKNGPYYSTFSAWQKATGQESGGYYGDPMVDASFRLKAGSPVIDKGVRIPGINDRFAGIAPDMGAHEYGTVQGPGAGSGNTTVPPGTQGFLLSGTVTDKTSVAVAGALITLSGSVSRTAVSEADGSYCFLDVPAGSYTLTVSKTGYVFEPSSRVVSVGGNQAGQNFVCAAAQPEATLSNAVAYPNPWKAGDSRSPVMKFKNLTQGTRIRIYSLDGELVKEICEPDKAEVQWDVAADNAGSGIYVCVMTNEKGETKKQKIAVMR